MKSLISLISLVMPLLVLGQYTEEFDVPEKGAITVHTPSFQTDLVGVNWSVALGSVVGTLSGATNYAKTVGGALEYRNTDRDVCFTTPILDISSPATSTLSIPFEAIDIEFGDFLQVSYQINGGAWVNLGNQHGGGSETVGRLSNATGDWDATGTISASGITGNTLTVRICGNTTSSLDFLKVFSVGLTNASVLPVKWANVEVNKDIGGNRLSWSTSSEVNNDRFEIERSIDNIEKFVMIASVNGAGNTSQMTGYQFLDQFDFPVSSKVYYRLKQIDYDGKYEYSPIVVVRNTEETIHRVSPNPFNDFLTFTTPLDDGDHSNIHLYNQQGSKIKEFKSLNGAVDTHDVPPGVYFVQFPSGEYTKLVKL